MNINSYCNDLREILFKKQLAHSIITSLALKLGKASPETLLPLHDNPYDTVPNIQISQKENVVKENNMNNNNNNKKEVISKEGDHLQNIERKDASKHNQPDQAISHNKHETKSSQGTKTNLNQQKISLDQTVNAKKINKSSFINTNFSKFQIDKHNNIFKSKRIKIDTISWGKYNKRINKWKTNTEQRSNSPRKVKKKQKMSRNSSISPKSCRNKENKSKKMTFKNTSKKNNVIREVDPMYEETPIIPKRIPKRKTFITQNISDILPKIVIDTNTKNNFSQNPTDKNRYNNKRNLDESSMRKSKNKTNFWLEGLRRDKFEKTYRNLIEAKGNVSKEGNDDNMSITKKEKENTFTQPQKNYGNARIRRFSYRFDEFQKEYQHKSFLSHSAKHDITIKRNTTGGALDAPEVNISISNMKQLAGNLDEEIHINLPKSVINHKTNIWNRDKSKITDISPNELSENTPEDNLSKQQLFWKFINSFEAQNIPDHTESEIEFHEINSHFEDLVINQRFSSNYLNQMTNHDREYFVEFQIEIVQNIKRIVDQYKKNKTGNILIKSDTLGNSGYKRYFEDGLRSSLVQSKPKMYIYIVYIF